MLRVGTWPVNPANESDFTAPAQVVHLKQRYEEFYRQRFSGRQLRWCHSMGRMDVNLLYLRRGKIELCGSDYQVGVLLAFAAVNQLTLAMLKGMTNLRDDELQRTVASLVSTGLLKTQNSVDSSGRYDQQAVFQLNLEYTTNCRRIKILASAPSESQKESQSVDAAVDSERKMFTEAAIVRIMKARKRITHVQLIEETIGQARDRFVPSVPLVKQCIEHLIEREYIKRSTESRDCYVYIA